MKKIILFASSFILTSAIFATEAKPATSKPEQPAAIKEAKTLTINLYSEPEKSSHIIKSLSANTNLVAIFKKGDWIKVGDQQDGSTGWINVNQYHEAKKAYYNQYFQNNLQTTYLHTTKDKDGKLIIEAYQNGKKLSDADAKKLYEKTQTAEQNQWKAMQRFNQIMNQEMQMDYEQARRQMDALYHSPVLFMPGVVVIEKPSAQKEKIEAGSQTVTTEQKSPVIKK